ncbi:unnamed protein product [Urochloa decumbens]|uniref:F-box domain-containing protein n=1 Tax=Urochloa decumbens TaxID=240449 RepID=A0ABC9FLA0_9POAL
MQQPTTRSRALPSLMEELVEEILLRVQLEEPPAHLVRAAMVCKAWRRILSDGGFRRRYCGFQCDRATPTLLGYVCCVSTGPGPQFVPTTSYFSPPPLPTRYGYRAIDCRHGRVLIQVTSQDGLPEDLIVCSLVTGSRHHLSFPACTRHQRTYDCTCSFTGAVLCARPASAWRLRPPRLPWRSVPRGLCADRRHSRRKACIIVPCTLVIGDALYFDLASDEVIKILKYDYDDLSGHGLSSVIDDVPQVSGKAVLVDVDGGLGMVQFDYYRWSIYTWSRRVDAYGVGEWVRHNNNVVRLETLIPTIHDDVRCPDHMMSIHFAEGTSSTVLLCFNFLGVFTLDLNSRQLREVNFNETCDSDVMLPYVSFYIPGIPLVPFFNFLSSHDPLMNIQSHDQTKCDNGT